MVMLSLSYSAVLSVPNARRSHESSRARVFSCHCGPARHSFSCPPCRRLFKKLTGQLSCGASANPLFVAADATGTGFHASPRRCIDPPTLRPMATICTPPRPSLPTRQCRVIKMRVPALEMRTSTGVSAVFFLELADKIRRFAQQMPVGDPALRGCLWNLVGLLKISHFPLKSLRSTFIAQGRRQVSVQWAGGLGTRRAHHWLDGSGHCRSSAAPKVICVILAVPEGSR